jgi:hypothetical protein
MNTQAPVLGASMQVTKKVAGTTDNDDRMDRSP